MPHSTFEKFLPASGVLAGVLLLVNGITTRMPSNGDTAGALQVVRDGEVANLVSLVAGALSAVALVFFAAGLRAALRSGEGGESSYSAVAHGGTLLLAGLMGTSAWLTIAALDAADQGIEATTVALATLLADNWVAFLAACAPMLLGTGLGGLRTAALPKWLAIASVVLGVLCFGGPTGFVVYFAMPFWLAVVGVVLSVRQRASAPSLEPAVVRGG